MEAVGSPALLRQAEGEEEDDGFSLLDCGKLTREREQGEVVDLNELESLSHISATGRLLKLLATCCHLVDTVGRTSTSGMEERKSGGIIRLFVLLWTPKAVRLEEESIRGWSVEVASRNSLAAAEAVTGAPPPPFIFTQ